MKENRPHRLQFLLGLLFIGVLALLIIKTDDYSKAYYKPRVLESLAYLCEGNKMLKVDLHQNAVTLYLDFGSYTLSKFQEGGVVYYMDDKIDMVFEEIYEGAFVRYKGDVIYNNCVPTS